MRRKRVMKPNAKTQEALRVIEMAIQYGLSVEKACGQAGISTSTWYRYNKGRKNSNCSPSIDEQALISEEQFLIEEELPTLDFSSETAEMLSQMRKAEVLSALGVSEACDTDGIGAELTLAARNSYPSLTSPQAIMRWLIHNDNIGGKERLTVANYASNLLSYEATEASWDALARGDGANSDTSYLNVAMTRYTYIDATADIIRNSKDCDKELRERALKTLSSITNFFVMDCGGMFTPSRVESVRINTSEDMGGSVEIEHVFFLFALSSHYLAAIVIQHCAALRFAALYQRGDFTSKTAGDCEAPLHLDKEVLDIWSKRLESWDFSQQREILDTLNPLMQEYAEPPSEDETAADQRGSKNSLFANSIHAHAVGALTSYRKV